MPEGTMKIGLGTAQFGLDYGISNRSGMTPEHEVKAILDRAKSLGIRTLDTAAAYGSSEEVLGHTLPEEHVFEIVTKIPALGSQSSPPGEVVESSLFASLERLRQSGLYGLLLHNADDAVGPSGSDVMERMREMKRRGLVKNIGVSVYSGDQIDRVLSHWDIDLIQLPLNVFDQRLIRSGHIEKLKARGIEIHARSVFLQGLLLMEESEVPNHLASARVHLSRFQKRIRSWGIPAGRAALGFVLGIAGIDIAIVGVNSLRQLDEIVSWGGPLDPQDFADAAVDDEGILNPSRWSAAA